MAWGHDTTVKDTESLLPKWWEQSLNTRDDEAGLPERDITPYIDPKTFDLNIAKNAEIAQNNTIVIGNEHYDKRDMSEGGDKTPHGFHAKGFYVQTARDVIARTDPNAYKKDFDYERGKLAEKLLGPMPMYDLDKPFPGKGKFDKRRGVNPRGSALTNYDAQRNITTAGHRPLTAHGMIKQVIFDELGINQGGLFSAKHGVVNPDDRAGLPDEDITPTEEEARTDGGSEALDRAVEVGDLVYGKENWSDKVKEYGWTDTYDAMQTFFTTWRDWLVEFKSVDPILLGVASSDEAGPMTPNQAQQLWDQMYALRLAKSPAGGHFMDDRSWTAFVRVMAIKGVQKAIELAGSAQQWRTHYATR